MGWVQRACSVIIAAIVKGYQMVKHQDDSDLSSSKRLLIGE